MAESVPLVTHPLQWTELRELQDTPPLDDADIACLAELRDVLARHGKLRRFAVHLAHRHFDLAPGEVLIERPDPNGRTQHVTVGRLADEPEARPTTWLFDDAPALRLTNAVYCVCVSSPQSIGACVRHGKSSSPGEKAIEEERIKGERIRREDEIVRQRPTAGHRRRVREDDDGRER